jgi:tRNA threonylcarbamoyl adenosine modification protein (Sua5/YciO/YrdC/YwlC family)
MIEYTVPQNPDDRILKKATDLLNDGKIVVVPTDTNWVMLANPFHKNGVERLYKIKGEDKSHHFSVLCSDISMASEVASIPDYAFRKIRGKIPGHYTFIFAATKKIIKALKASKTDHQIGIRFVPSLLIDRLLEAHGGCLLSTNIDRPEAEEEIFSYQLEELLRGKVDMIIDPGEYEFSGYSTIYDFSGDSAELVRVGAGNLF